MRSFVVRYLAVLVHQLQLLQLGVDLLQVFLVFLHIVSGKCLERNDELNLPVSALIAPPAWILFGEGD